MPVSLFFSIYEEEETRFIIFQMHDIDMRKHSAFCCIFYTHLLHIFMFYFKNFHIDQRSLVLFF